MDLDTRRNVARMGCDMQDARQRQRRRRFSFLAWLCLILLPLVGMAQEEATPSDRPLRDEPGLEARRQRYASHPAKSIALFPVRVIELPFQLLNYPVEHWFVRKRPEPLTEKVVVFLRAAEEDGVSIEARLESGHSGFGGGVGYRLPHSLTGPVNLRFFGGATNRGYQQYFVQLDTLRVGSANLWLRGQYLDLAQESYYGPLGIDSELDQRSNYELQIASAILYGEIAGDPTFKLTFDGGFSRNDARPGENDEFPTTHSLFAGVEGLDERLDFVEGGLALVWDRRDNPTYTNRGSFAQASVHLVGGVGDTDNSFAKYGLEVRQYLPLPGARRTLGLRIAGMITDNFADAEIPFFRLERLGGSRTLRGVQTYRFSDKDMLRGGLEYRFPFWFIGLENGAAIDALAFFDFGTVMPNLEEMTWRDLQPTGGFGFRIVARDRVFVRTDFAWSEEDSRVHIGFGSLH